MANNSAAVCSYIVDLFYILFWAFFASINSSFSPLSLSNMTALKGVKEEQEGEEKEEKILIHLQILVFLFITPIY